MTPSRESETSGSATALAGVTLLVYDLDGTLLDAFEDIQTAANEAFAEVGLAPLGLERVRGAVGDGTRKLIERLLGEEHAGLFEPTLKAFMHAYRDNSAPRARLYGGVLETLAALRGAGLRQAILTNKPQAVTDATCRRLGLSEAVDGVWGAREGVPLKPNPEALLAIARQFGCAPAACAMVGDYRADFEVARAAGTRLVGVTWGLWDRAQIEAQNPDAVIDRMAELPRLLGR